MTTLDKSFELGEMRSFDPQVFVGDIKHSQDFCNLILTLAVICNELKDLYVFKQTVEEVSPVKKGNRDITVEQGNFGGITIFVQRLTILKFHELSKLLKKYLNVLNSDEFNTFIRIKLSKAETQNWQSSVEILTRDDNVDKFKNILARIRHKTVGHLDPEQIFEGYKYYFLDHKDYMEPLLSKGTGIMSTRFYFADASPEGFMVKIHKDSKSKFINKELDELINHLYNSIWMIVIKFIEDRSTYKNPALDKLPTPEQIEIEM